MATCNEVVVISDEIKSPPPKKLKQARLSFPILSPKTTESPTAVTKKRKLSEGDGATLNTAHKAVKTENGDPVKILKVENSKTKPVVDLEDDTEPTKLPNVDITEAKIVKPNEDVADTVLEKSLVSGNKSDTKESCSAESDAKVNQTLSSEADAEVNQTLSSEPDAEVNQTLSSEPDGEVNQTLSSEPDGEVNQTFSSEQDISEVELNSSKSEVDCDESSSCNESSFLVSPEEKSIDENKDPESSTTAGSESKDCDKDSLNTGNKPDAKSTEKCKKATVPGSKIGTKRKLSSGEKVKRDKTETQKEREERLKSKAKAREEREKFRKEKEEQRKKRLEEKEKQKEERIKKKQAEIEAKLEEKKQKEEERKAKLEEKKQKEEERKKKEDQKLAEKKKKEEERKQKEEERRQKEEERKQKEEEKLRAEEEEKNKKEKVAKAFASFFVPKKSDAKVAEEQLVECQGFMPFQVKADMRLAAQTRAQLNKEAVEVLDQALEDQSCKNLYLDELKAGKKTKRSRKTWPLEELKDNDVQIIDEEESLLDSRMDVEVESGHVKHPRPKLFLFEENRRPPYWGTWRKKSAKITSRKPFIKDENFFDYEVDSDDEWEEEEESGESLKDSDEEVEPEDDYEIDNDFLVPHGYLSDEEGQGEDDDEVTTPETQEARLNLMKQEFEEERKQKTSQIKPRIIGCFWTDEEENESVDPVYAQLLKIMSRYKAATCLSSPVPTSFNKQEMENSNGDSDPMNQKPTGSAKKKKFPEQAVPDLVRLIHGNVNSRVFLVKEFTAFWCRSSEMNREDIENTSPKENTSPIPKSCISRKIKELATWQMCIEEGPLLGRMCWYVSKDVLEKLGLGELGIPNKWTYILKPKRESTPSVVESPVGASPGASPPTNMIEAVQKTPKTLITKFTKVLTPEERQKQLLQNSTTGGPDDTGNAKSLQIKSCRKRITPLVSVPRGQEIPRISTLAHLFSKPVINSLVSSEVSEKTVEMNKVAENNSEKQNGSDSVNCITLD